MKKIFQSLHSLFEKLGQIRFKELIAVVPPDLKVQFAQIQLKNSLHRLKLLGIFTFFFNVLNWLIYILRADEISSILFHKLFLTDLSQLIITLLFFLLSGYFSKKDKNFMLLFLCYSFIILHFILSAYTMLFAEIFLVLQLFFTGTFLFTFVLDFKPKIFISFLVLWYLTLVGLLTYNSQSFAFGGPQVFALNIFLIALVIRIMNYNSKVKTFVNTFRINTLNKKLGALSTTDELTKLNNRRSFLEYMNTIWILSRRLQTPVNVLMIDVTISKSTMIP
jgi:hypothetical protein